MSETAFKPFGACLAELLARHRLTAASVSRMMGHKSRTTLRRILQEQANSESIKKFLDEFRAARIIELTDQENSELDQALEISRIGLNHFLAKRSISRLLHPVSSESEQLNIRLHTAGEKRAITADEFFAGLSGAVRLQFLIINSVPAAFFSALAGFLKKTDQASIAIDHYFFLNDDVSRTVQFIDSIFPALKFPSYTPYAIPQSLPESGQSARLSASILACRAEFPGETHEFQLGSSAPGIGELISARAGVYDFWKSMLEPGVRHRLPVKLSSGVSGGSLNSYLKMAEAYLRLEKNHAVYLLKPGLCLSLIAPEILEAPMQDGMLQTAYRDDPGLDDFLRRLTGIQIQRFENMYHKKRVTHVILSYESIKEFIRTGRLTDHFFGMRPFTAAERREILTHCRNQSRDNPYFNLYFLKSDAEHIDREAACYESSGVLIYASGTDYNLTGEHADALITLEPFTALLTRYFRETLLPLRVHSVSASLSMLASLIDEIPKE